MSTPPRTIHGAVLQSGKIHKAGDEDALYAVLPEADAQRLVQAGHLSGDWSKSQESEEGETDSEEEEGLPTLAELPGHVAGLKTADDVKALRKTDKRKGAKSIYEARLAEIKGED